MIVEFLGEALALNLESIVEAETLGAWFSRHPEPETIARFAWNFSMDHGPLPPLATEAESLEPGPLFRYGAEMAGLPEPQLLRHGALNTVCWPGQASVTYRMGRGYAQGTLSEETLLPPEPFRTGILLPTLLECLRGRGYFPLLFSPLPTTDRWQDGRFLLHNGSTIDWVTGELVTAPKLPSSPELHAWTLPHSQIVYQREQEAALRCLYQSTV